MQPYLMVIVLVLAHVVAVPVDVPGRPHPQTPAATESWREFSSEEIGIRAELPAEPQLDVIPLSGELAKFNPRSFASRGNAIACALVRLEVPTLEGSAQGAFLDLMTKEFISSQLEIPDAEVRNVEPALLGGQPAKQFVLAIPSKKLEMVGRIALCGNRCYVAMGGGTLPYPGADVARFLDSIRFGDCGPPRRNGNDRVGRERTRKEGLTPDEFFGWLDPSDLPS